MPVVRKEASCMMRRPWSTRLASATAVSAVLVVSACGSNPRPQVAAKPPVQPAKPQAPATPPPAPAVTDPIQTLIDKSQQRFDEGERELKAGHLDRARAAFDASISVLLESPYGARTEPRLRAQFDRLVDRINAYEVTSLAQGDGFTEKPSEAAPIDDILANFTTFTAPPPDEAMKAAVKADIEKSEHDIPIPDNPKVLAYIQVFQTRLRDYIQDSLERGAKYLPMIQTVFRAEGLPLDLAYIPIIESSFKTNALSKASAKGPWQFMKATAQEHGLKTDWFIDERSDPEKATVAAASYLKALSTMFDGDWNLVLAAYNGGPGRVQHAMKASGLSDFWELSKGSRYLPRETREYVPLIFAAMIVARNPVQYGFDAVTADPIQYEKVELPHPIDLRRVAEWAGTSVDEIQALNPELRRWTTPVKYPNYEVKVPVGTADRLEARLAEASPSDFTALKWYTVRKGETLLAVARKFGVARSDVAEANNISVRVRLHAGQEIIIPRAPATLLAARTERTAPTAVASRSLAAEAERPAAMHTSAAPQLTRITYRVKRGDTLSSIAELFDTTVAKIKSWNRMHSNALVAGTR
ncbi:MAG TPA: LysM peptidoglycan-binding domain-containing protein, partial [Vicinamibacterales bacterium]|nr:LysM peptidoglycan-binding domain-containing protein [Vicinamibacterales bacterium]